MDIIFRTLSLGVAMPFMQGCDLLNPTNCRINTVVNMGDWMDLYDTLCKFGFGIQNISKHFSSIILRHKNHVCTFGVSLKIGKMGGSDIYTYIYIIILNIAWPYTTHTYIYIYIYPCVHSAGWLCPLNRLQTQPYTTKCCLNSEPTPLLQNVFGFLMVGQKANVGHYKIVTQTGCSEKSWFSTKWLSGNFTLNLWFYFPGPRS